MTATAQPAATTRNRPRPANNNHAYVSAYKYEGDGLEVVKNLNWKTANQATLKAVRDWHRSAWRRHNTRHQKIAAAIAEVMV